MEVKNFTLCIAFFFLLLPSCIIKSPKYSTLPQVMALEIGMSRTEVEKKLGIEPYNIKEKNDSSTVFIYVYRVTDRRTLSFNTKPVNGKETLGKYIPLAVTYSKDSTLRHLEACNLCDDKLMSMSKLDFEKILMFITVTLPVILIYLGLRKA